MKPIWIVDDDQSIRWVLEKTLARENLPCQTFSNAQDALMALEGESPQVLVSDIRMPGGVTANAGLELLQAAKQKYPGLPVIIMTAFSDLESAVSAFQGGAFEYLPKPFDVDQAVELIRRAVDESLREAAAEERIEATPEILGQAQAMQDVFRAIGRLSQSNVTVLITGESGTGKELVAKALHRHSPRAARPFIALNTAAIPKDLLESELFGHERGAFTGAQTMRRGRFEQAEDGTLFLDEIGDMPAELQTRLLRVLSDGHFYRVGGHNPLKANVRVIAATHQNLDELVRQGLFREDLYHRLNVIRLRLPPLRERAEDIPLLVKNFLQKSAKELGVSEPKRLSDAAMRLLCSLPLPGNVRQLENLCHWLTVMAPAQVVEVKDLPPELRLPSAGTAAPEPRTKPRSDESVSESSAAVAAAYQQRDHQQRDYQQRDEASLNNQASVATTTTAEPWESDLGKVTANLLVQGRENVMDELTRQFEATIIRVALRYTGGRRIEAAQRLGIGRNTITRKIQELGLENEDR